MASKEVDELRREIHKRGFDTERDGKGHYNIFKDGEIIRTQKGVPLTIPGTPSDHRALKNAVSILRDHGVLPKPAEVKANGHRQNVKLKRDRLKQYSDALRGEVVELMKKYGLSQSDISHFADYYAHQHGSHRPTFGQGVLSKFLKGTSLGNENYNWLTQAVSAINAAEGQIPKADETRGMMSRQKEKAEKGIEVVTEEKVKPMPPKLPKLAFEVMQMIYKEEKDDSDVIDLVHKVAKLELNMSE
jgi:hypothetical protein